MEPLFKCYLPFYEISDFFHYMFFKVTELKNVISRFILYYLIKDICCFNESLDFLLDCLCAASHDFN